MSALDRIRSAWNAIRADNPNFYYKGGYGPSTPRMPRNTSQFGSEKTILSSITTRMAIDAASIEIRHILLDDEGRYKEDANSKLNQALTWEPNIDQGPQQFRQDLVQTMFDNAVAVVVPIDTTLDPSEFHMFDVLSMRVGRVLEYHPGHLKVRVFNEETMQLVDVMVPKQVTAVIQNPLMAVMNEPNSTLQRLIRKLNLLDVIDEASSSGKLDLIIQLPYVVKSEARANQAEARRKAIEDQLSGSKYGIAYTDGTEKVTQLNRPAENNMLAQVQFLHDLLYSQLGVTPGVMDGTADEATMINYYNRSIEPILTAACEGMRRAFLGRATVRKKEDIRFFRDPFKLVPVTELANIADVFSRNEIMTPNEFREIVGRRPSPEKKADQLTNSNMPQAGAPQEAVADTSGLDEIETALDEVFADLGGADGA
jgi:hypothetical protein